jgi:hypothetical protein
MSTESPETNAVATRATFHDWTPVVRVAEVSSSP